MSGACNRPDYVNPRDAYAFLRGGNSQSQLVATCFFNRRTDDSEPVYDQVRARINARLPYIPRLAQHVVATPLKLARPAWFDAESIDLDYHVQSKRVSGGEFPELMQSVEDVLAPLDLTRPPWRIYVVEGFDDGKWAVVIQCHHVLGDGAACVALFGLALLDMDLLAPPQVACPKAVAPPTAELVRQGLLWRGRDLMRRSRNALETMHSRDRRAAAARNLTRLAKLVSREIRHPYKPAAINQPASGDWVFRTISRPLEELRALADSTPRATVNTVYLAALAHALEEALAAAGQPLQAPLKIGIPKSLRRDTSQVCVNSATETGNLVISAPLSQDDPLALLRSITDRQRHALDSDEPGTRAMLGKGGAVQTWPMKWNVTATSLNGPPDGVSCLGGRLEQCLLAALPGGTKSLGLVGSAYNGNLAIMLTADRSLAPLVDRVCAGMHAWLDDLGKQVVAADRARLRA